MANLDNLLHFDLKCKKETIHFTHYDQFAPNFDMAFKTTQCASVPNLKLFGPAKTELWPKKLEDFLLHYMGKWAGLVDILLPTNMAAAI